MARFRLRFLLQELDLVGPLVTVGRSSECQISLDDPLVSRVHAQITLGEDGATVRDLGSRNGVRVNGHVISGETPLTHKDRLRLGTQDLVFLTVRDESARHPRATGSMVHCNQCGRPFPVEVPSCPRCGTPAPTSEVRDTVTSVESEGSSWTFRLLAEVIERALASGRFQDAERMLDRAARPLDELVRTGEHVGDEQIAHAARLALRLAAYQGAPDWASWAVRLYRSQMVLPVDGALEQLEGMRPELLRALRPELEALLIDYVVDRSERT
ncbi:MAG: FHA domain-containing protein, partial [Polyangiales bacterium]